MEPTRPREHRRPDSGAVQVLERDREAVRGRPGEPGARDQAGEGGGPGLERRQDEGGFVENADSARVVHALILPSRIVKCKQGRA